MHIKTILDKKSPLHGYLWLKSSVSTSLDCLAPITHLDVGVPEGGSLVEKDSPAIAPSSGENPLFLIFADLNIYFLDDDTLGISEKTHEAILKFANSYGAVEVPQLRLDNIVSEIKRMRAAILLWRAIKVRGTPKGMSDHLWNYYSQLLDCQSDHCRQRSQNELRLDDLRTSQQTEELIADWRKKYLPIFHDEFNADDNPLLPEANAFNDSTAVPSFDLPGKELDWGKRMLIAILKKRLSNPWELKLLQSEKNIIKLAISTCELRRVMWLQLALAIDENRDYRHCETCQKPFLVSEKTDKRQHRADKKFCSDNCRTNALNKRKRRARELFTQGESVADIAEEIGSTVKTVKSWLMH